MPIMNLKRPSGANLYVATEFIECVEHNAGGGSIIHMISGKSVEVAENPDDLFEPSRDNPFFDVGMNEKVDA